MKIQMMLTGILAGWLTSSAQAQEDTTTPPAKEQALEQKQEQEPERPELVLTQETIQEVSRLISAGQVEEAEKLIRGELEKHPRSFQVRFYLSQILQYDGRPDEAMKVLQAGLTDDADKITRLNLLLYVGDLALSRAEDGPFISRRRGSLTARPPGPEDDEKAFVKQYISLAEKSYRDALELSPENQLVYTKLARALTVAGKNEEAVKLWENLLKKYPDSSRIVLTLASLKFELKQADEAVALLKQGLKTHPGDAEMIQLLVEHYTETSNEKELAYWTPRYQFYEAVPAFIGLEYSQENYDALTSLSEAKIEALLTVKSPESSQLLAVYCYSHPHNELEDQAFVELGNRQADQLLWGLMEHAQSTCTIRGSAAQLARSKPEELFEHLARLLPGDRQSFGMEMDIANAMDVLQDPRAVSLLAVVLAPDNQTRLEDPIEGIGLEAARERAALALGGFDTEESRQALEKGLKNPQLRLACAGGLYRLDRKPEHLAILEKAGQQEPGLWTILKRLTEKLPQDKQLAQLLAQVEKRLREERQKEPD